MFNNKGQKKRRGIHFEIIPMIDVMMILVLFLSVMAFLPQVQSAIQTDVPESGASDEVTADDVMITMKVDGNFVADETIPVSESELIPKVKQIIGTNTKRRVVIAADKNLPYEKVVAVLAQLQASGLRNVALATEKKQ